MSLSTYLKSTKYISFLANQFHSQHANRMIYIMGNQGNDPDSVIGAISFSLLLFIEKNEKKEKFGEFMTFIKGDFDVLQAQELLLGSDLEFIVPVIDSYRLDRVLSQTEIKYINNHFDLGLSEALDLNHLGVIKRGITPKIGLFDHNSPSLNLKTELEKISENQKLKIVFDHHNIADQDYTDKFDRTQVEVAGSCHSLLFRFFSEQQIDIFLNLFPDLIKLGALIIQFDTFNFFQRTKGSRWFEYEHQLVQRLREISTYGSIDEDLEEMMNLKYSKAQFETEFPLLYYADSKLFTYPGDRVVEYSVYFASMKEYIKVYGGKQLMENAIKLLEKRYIFE